MCIRDRSPGAVGPLFQQMFVFQREDQELPPLPFSIESLDFYGGVAKFDLDLSLVERAGEVTGTLEYDAELFDDDTIRRMLGHLDELMRDAVARPDTPVAMLNLLTAEERALALGPWNATAVEFPSERTLHELIQDVADADPGPVAVIRGDATWTRGQIAQHAERLARALRGAGVRRGDVVAICLDRSPEMVWGILGILRAGAAYLPIDPKYPPERVAFMLDDARARVTLTQRTLHDRLAGGGRSVWVLDEDLPASVVAASAPPDHATAADLCYVIYTSGSTGRPKGVMVDHRGRVSNFLDFNRRFAVGPADRLLSVSSIGFDMCAYDVLGTLAAGAAIVLPDAGRELDPSHWLTLIARHRVSVWHSVPALAGLLVEAGRAEPSAPLTSIRLVLLGGDWIPVPLAGELWEQSPRATVVSLGGATEVSMDSTIYVIEQVDPSWRSVPYGRPMANQLAYVLDASGELCPVGVPGELFLGGIGVGWGYLAQPGMTAARFVPDPFAAPGARMYRTGDLARYTRDGTLELLGRIDFQTKIRGHRIELGEIEAALRACGAGQAIVVAVAAPGGRDKRLVGYVLPREGEQLEAEPLRRALSQRVPDYMVPPHVIVLDRFPLTPNGKIDRKSLPAPDAVAATARVVAAPHTPLQQRLHGLWRELLHVESLSIDDDFFAIGGDSIKAIQLTSRARAAGLTLTPADLFRHPTVRELAAVATETSPRLGDREEVARGASLSAERRAALEANLGPIEAIEEVGPMQAHMIRQLARSEVPGLYVNRSGLVLPRVHSRSFQAAWERLLERHSILRSCFVWRDLPRPLRVVLREITLPLRVVDLRGLGRVAQERAVVELAQEERERGFDLEHPPLFRLVLVHLDDDCTILLETEAYPILDGWSAFVLRRELLTAYQAELSGEDVALPAAPPYRAYVDWAHAQGTDAARAYWTTALAACPLLSRAPAPLRGPLARADRRLARADTRALSERARHDGVTLSSLVTLAWAVVESAGGEDALFGVTSSGRSPLIAQCEDVVGLCINTLPVWAHLEGSAQLSALARLLHEQRALAAEHETAPLDELTAALGQRDRLFESVVVFANYPIDPVLRGVEAAAPPFPFAEQLHLAQTEFPLRLDVTVDEELTATAFYYQGTLGAEDVARRLDTLLAALRELGAGVAGTVAELRGRL